MNPSKSKSDSKSQSREGKKRKLEPVHTPGNMSRYFATTKRTEEKKMGKESPSPVKKALLEEREPRALQQTPSVPKQLGSSPRVNKWLRLKGDLTPQRSPVSVVSNGIPVPISSLTLNGKVVPCISGRIVNKAPLRQTKTGKVFSFVLTDESGTVGVCAFDETATKFESAIKINHCILIENFKVGQVNLKFATTDNPLEVRLQMDTVIKDVVKKTKRFPGISFDFSKINDILTMEKGSVVDVIGIIHEEGEVEEKTSSSTGVEYKKQRLYITDDSEVECDEYVTKPDGTLVHITAVNAEVIIRLLMYIVCYVFYMCESTHVPSTNSSFLYCSIFRLELICGTVEWKSIRSTNP